MDGIVRYLFGNTPGKALLNTKIVKDDGTTIGLSKSIERSANVWLFAFAAGLPLVSFITQYFAFKSAQKHNGKGFWDKYTKTQVEHGSITKLNVLLFIVILIFLYSALSLFSMGLAEDKHNLQKYKTTAQQPQPASMSTAAPLPPKPASQMTEEEIRAEHTEAQALFKQLYPDILTNPAKLAEANKRFYAKIDQGKSIRDAMLEAGRETQDYSHVSQH